MAQPLAASQLCAPPLMMHSTHSTSLPCRCLQLRYGIGVGEPAIDNLSQLPVRRVTVRGLLFGTKVTHCFPICFTVRRSLRSTTAMMTMLQQRMRALAPQHPGKISSSEVMYLVAHSATPRQPMRQRACSSGPGVMTAQVLRACRAHPTRSQAVLAAALATARPTARPLPSVSPLHSATFNPRLILGLRPFQMASGRRRQSRWVERACMAAWQSSHLRCSAATAPPLCSVAQACKLVAARQN
jgi:hypothetical protein